VNRRRKEIFQVLKLHRDRLLKFKMKYGTKRLETIPRRGLKRPLNSWDWEGQQMTHSVTVWKVKVMTVLNLWLPVSF